MLVNASFASRNTKPSAFSGRLIWMMYALISTRSPTVIVPRATCWPASSITAAMPAPMQALWPICSVDSAYWLSTPASRHASSTRSRRLRSTSSRAKYFTVSTFSRLSTTREFDSASSAFTRR